MHKGQQYCQYSDQTVQRGLDMTHKTGTSTFRSVKTDNSQGMVCTKNVLEVYNYYCCFTSLHLSLRLYTFWILYNASVLFCTSLLLILDLQNSTLTKHFQLKVHLGLFLELVMDIDLLTHTCVPALLVL